MPLSIPWKKLSLAVGALVAIAVAVHFVRGNQGHAAPRPGAAAQTVPVKTATATRGDMVLSLKVNAYAEAYSTVTVQSRVSGQLQSLAFKPGGRVSAGEVIERIDPSLLQAQLDEAMGALAKDQAQLTDAEAVLRRYTPLLAKGYVSQNDLDTYKANVGIFAASVKADRAAVEMARTQLGYARIHAPVDSIAGAPLVYPGAQVTANSTNLVVLNQVRPIYLTFSVPESTLAGIKAAIAGSKVPVTATVPGSKGKSLQATLDFINNAVDTTTGTIQLKASYLNTDDRLTPGEYVQVSLPTARLANVVTVPVVALQNSPDGNFVFVVGDGGSVQQRMVTAGPADGGKVVIEKGLNGGERVVTDGQMLLTNGTHVRVVGS